MFKSLSLNIRLFTLNEKDAAIGAGCPDSLRGFASLKQPISCSRVEARNAKPVVLTRTYGIAKPVTSLGGTLARGGISSRKVLLALGDDRIMVFHRQHLDPQSKGLTGNVEKKYNDGEQSAPLDGRGWVANPTVPLERRVALVA